MKVRFIKRKNIDNVVPRRDMSTRVYIGDSLPPSQKKKRKEKEKEKNRKKMKKKERKEKRE